MAYNPSAFGPKPFFIDAAGNPLVGGKLFAYVAGSTSTKQDTFTNSTGMVQNTNPIILNSLGQTPNEFWWTAGLLYKIVLAPATDTDPPTNPIWTIDNLEGMNDTAGSANTDEWVLFGASPTYVNATTFTMVGNQTDTFLVGRRVKTTNTAGTSYGTIISSVYGALTTVTLLNTSGVLDSGLSAAYYGILTPSNPSYPSLLLGTEGASVVSATTTNIWSPYGNTVHVTGNATITSFGTAIQEGTWQKVIFDGSPILTQSASLNINGGGSNIQIAPDDLALVYADTTTQADVFVIKKDGTPISNVSVPVRQTVLSGPLDTNGLPSFGGSVGAATLTASGTLISTASNGFSLTQGAINRIGSITNPAWTSPGGSGTGYLSLIINADGTCTPTVRILAPTYRPGGADVITNGQFTFNYQEMVGKVGNGTTAAQSYEVFVGECPYTAGVWSGTIIWYGLMGRYTSAQIATLPASNTAISANHNLGFIPKVRRWVVIVTTAFGSFTLGDEMSVILWTSANLPMPSIPVASRLSLKMSTGNSVGSFFSNSPSSGAATDLTGSANCAYRWEAERGW